VPVRPGAYDRFMTASPRPPLLKRLPLGVWVGAFWMTVVVVRSLQRADEIRHLGNLQGNMEDGVLLITAVTTTVVCLLLFRAPTVAVLVALAGYLAALKTSVPASSAALFFLADVVVGYGSATRPRRVSLAMAALPIALTGGYALWETVEGYRSSALVTQAAFAGTTLIGWLVGNTIHQSRSYAAALQSRATQQAVTAERLRIARELHDMVAHSIGIIAIQAGVGSRVMDTQPAETRNALQAIEATSRETLAGLRRLLGGLRQSDPDRPDTARDPGLDPPRDPAPGLADLDRLVARTAAAGLRVDVRRRGEPRPLPSDIDLSAYRIVQEAVTNVVRHSGTRDCSVTLDYGDDRLALTIVDLGCAPATSAIPGHGFGLIGMRERVSLLHGTFSAGPRQEGGFQVTAHLPLPAEMEGPPERAEARSAGAEPAGAPSARSRPSVPLASRAPEPDSPPSAGPTRGESVSAGTERTAADRVAMERAAMERTPVDRAATGNTPAGSTPSGPAPAERAVADRAATGHTPAERTPAGPAPAERAPARQADAAPSGRADSPVTRAAGVAR
jgi:signal transduction histidine kinase